jgi:hypothetical protein
MSRPFVLNGIRAEVLEKLDQVDHVERSSDLGYVGAAGARVDRTLHELRKHGLVSLVEGTARGPVSGDHHSAIKRIAITPLGREVVKARPESVPSLRDAPIQFTQEQMIAIKDEFVADLKSTDVVPMGPTMETRAHPSPVTGAVEAVVKTEPPRTFPLLEAIQTRTAKTAQAAELLEAAGLVDLAVQALEAVKFTALEKEYLAYVEAHP